jgi:hypothetical protein
LHEYPQQYLSLSRKRMQSNHWCGQQDEFYGILSDESGQHAGFEP